MKQDVARNQLQNVEILDVALSDSVGNIEFSQPTEDDVGYGSSSIEANESEATIEVPTTTGDHLIAGGKIPAPNVVKIDVEGSEPLVLEGLEKSLSAPVAERYTARFIYREWISGLLLKISEVQQKT
ncbi:FkbM family methyltransferase [Halolamina pelagica]|uniref:FkbM family methyltransferase n=1 Tax=Halolamina pelagica TaxID=699431 RepID=UPI00166FC2A0|nr:FkbM family methyltransferase [Halolamina pelagica]